MPFANNEKIWAEANASGDDVRHHATIGGGATCCATNVNETSFLYGYNMYGTNLDTEDASAAAGTVQTDHPNPTRKTTKVDESTQHQQNEVKLERIRRSTLEQEEDSTKILNGTTANSLTSTTTSASSPPPRSRNNSGSRRSNFSLRCCTYNPLSLSLAAVIIAISAGALLIASAAITAALATLSFDSARDMAHKTATMIAAACAAEVTTTFSAAAETADAMQYQIFADSDGRTSS